MLAIKTALSHLKIKLEADGEVLDDDVVRGVCEGGAARALKVADLKGVSQYFYSLYASKSQEKQNC